MLSLFFRYGVMGVSIHSMDLEYLHEIGIGRPLPES